jgi:hypothetical protein
MLVVLPTSKKKKQLGIQTGRQRTNPARPVLGSEEIQVSPRYSGRTSPLSKRKLSGDFSEKKNTTETRTIRKIRAKTKTKSRRTTDRGGKVTRQMKDTRRETRQMFKRLELKRLKKQFDAIDTDKSHELDTNELVVLFAALGCKNVTDRVVHELILKSDVNRSGTLDFDEFLILYNTILHSNEGYLATAKKNINKIDEQLKSYRNEQRRFQAWKAAHPEKDKLLMLPRSTRLAMFREEELMRRHTEEYLREKSLGAKEVPSGGECEGQGGGTLRSGSGMKMSSLFA